MQACGDIVKLFEYRLLTEYITGATEKATIPRRQKLNNAKNCLHTHMEGKANLEYVIPNYLVYGPTGDSPHA